MIRPGGETAIECNALSVLYSELVLLECVGEGKYNITILDMKVMIHAKMGEHAGEALRFTQPHTDVR